MDEEEYATEREALSEQLREVIAEVFAKSDRVKNVLRTIEERGYKPNVWMLLGIFLTPAMGDEIPEFSCSGDFQFTETDLEWLRSLKININDL
jgi:hypothetical protein